MAPPTFAAQETIESYSAALAPYDMAFTHPEGFRNLDIRGRSYLSRCITGSDIGHPGDICGVALEANNQEAVLLFPQFYLDFMTPQARSASYVERTLRENLKNDSLDIRPLVNIITRENMSQYSNADTVLIYEFDFQNPYIGHYNHCVGVYMRKYGHPAMEFKIALDDVGYRNKEHYINILFDSVKYGDERVEKMLEIETRDASKKDFDFPSAPLRHPRGGIRMNDAEAALSRVWNQGGHEAMEVMMDYYSSDEYKQLRHKRENEKNVNEILLKQ